MRISGPGIQTPTALWFNSPQTGTFFCNACTDTLTHRTPRAPRVPTPHPQLMCLEALRLLKLLLNIRSGSASIRSTAGHENLNNLYNAGWFVICRGNHYLCDLKQSLQDLLCKILPLLSVFSIT